MIHNEPGIEHIFSELYFVPQQIKSDYYKVKALELLYIWTLCSFLIPKKIALISIKVR